MSRTVSQVQVEESPGGPQEREHEVQRKGVRGGIVAEDELAKVEKDDRQGDDERLPRFQPVHASVDVDRVRAEDGDHEHVDVVDDPWTGQEDQSGHERGVAICSKKHLVIGFLFPVTMRPFV